MKSAMMKLTLGWLLAASAGWSLAKLPALSPEAKVKAEEVKAKAAWSDKLAAFQLCKSQDKVAARYLKGKDAKAVVPTPPCADPGPFLPPAAVDAAAASAVAATVARTK